MHPPFSVIFFTTLSGMGQGLFIALYLAQWVTRYKGITVPTLFFTFGLVLVLLLLGGGLVASIFHLGHPERAWRSAAKWRTSWLSREVIALPLLMFLVFLCIVVSFFPAFNKLLFTVGTLSVNTLLLLDTITLLFVFILFICTGMIYACLRFLQEWHSPLTIINFVLMGTASGFTLAIVLANFMVRSLIPLFVIASLIMTILAGVVRLISLARNKRLRPKSTLQSALGIPHPKIFQKSMGFMGGSFNTREFFHGKSKLFFRSIKWIFLACAFVIPILVLSLHFSSISSLLAVMVILIQYFGLVCERWYFFAEAKHPQNLYYQAIS